jgi:hypothetical protein
MNRKADMSMRRTLWSMTAVTAMAIPLAGLTPAVANAATAGSPTPAPSASPAIDEGCSTPGFKYTVKDTGIHIRKSPSDSGTSLASIPQGATFLTEMNPANTLGWLCITNHQFNGTYWVYGENPAHPSVNGWVGVNFMTFDGEGNGY